MPKKGKQQDVQRELDLARIELRKHLKSPIAAESIVDGIRQLAQIALTNAQNCEEMSKQLKNRSTTPSNKTWLLSTTQQLELLKTVASEMGLERAHAALVLLLGNYKQKQLIIDVIDQESPQRK